MNREKKGATPRSAFLCCQENQVTETHKDALWWAQGFSFFADSD